MTSEEIKEDAEQFMDDLQRKYLVADIQHDCPALLPLLDSAVAWVEGGYEIAARTSDGVVVALGSVVLRRDRLNLASYLEAHPTPDTW